MLQEALKDLRLKLNVDKTKFMLFSRARAIDYININISTMNKLMIERVTEYKYLGIWIDEKLSFMIIVCADSGKNLAISTEIKASSPCFVGKVFLKQFSWQSWTWTITLP